ncbi:MAG: AAA family ATPase [Candidatus Hodarchaeota archaeon]
MKIITCFSYKGGAGRTVAASNIAAALASKRKKGSVLEPLKQKVAIIDLDVFSAGTHKVFNINEDLIKNEDNTWIQDFFFKDISPDIFCERGGIRFGHKAFNEFENIEKGINNCMEEFVVFPANPNPDSKFVVQKYHENLLFELFLNLESLGYDYVILDGESGIRSMAEIALRLSDVVLMFFRLTIQHLAGTLRFVTSGSDLFKVLFEDRSFYLIPTVVPLVNKQFNIYQETESFIHLKTQTESIPSDIRINGYSLDDYAMKNKEKSGFFWYSDPNDENKRQICIHESLYLKGKEGIHIFNDNIAQFDQAVKDYYTIAKILKDRHPAN